jgi:hypothetical protein
MIVSAIKAQRYTGIFLGASGKYKSASCLSNYSNHLLVSKTLADLKSL